MDAPPDRFVFALCNPGAERALKHEVSVAGLDWRPSYQRRGFVTFKVGDGFKSEDLRAPLACALRVCESLGKFGSMADAEQAMQQAGVDCMQRMKFEDHRIRPQHEGGLPSIGDRVGTVVELAENECWVGIHQHAHWLSPYAGGNSGIEMPETSPSRAWLKLEEAVRFFGLQFSSKDIVVELGCAPGGVVHALLERGVSVIGVDPAKMADVVLAYAVECRDEVPADRVWFYHCRKPAALTAKRDLGRGVTWFMSDMNQAPEVVLRECARFVKMAPEIRGVLITLKLGKLEEIERKSSWIAALAEIGFGTVRVQQLAVHHREFALLGLRE